MGRALTYRSALVLSVTAFSAGATLPSGQFDVCGFERSILDDDRD